LQIDRWQASRRLVIGSVIVRPVAHLLLRANVLICRERSAHRAMRRSALSRLRHADDGAIGRCGWTGFPLT
jgi:hypothetical protein